MNSFIVAALVAGLILDVVLFVKDNNFVIVASVACSFLMGIYVPICKQYFPAAVYNILITVINGGVQMVIYFPIYKIIFPEGEQK